MDKVEAIYAQRHNVAVEIGGKLINVGVPVEFFNSTAFSGSAAPTSAAKDSDAASSDDGAVTSPFEANLVAWKVSDGESVAEGEAIATVEAMKMESAVKAPRTGTITLLAKEGDRLETSTVIATIE